MDSINRIIISYVCGDRNTRTQSMFVELELRSKTDRIVEELQSKRKFIINYNHAKSSMLKTRLLGLQRCSENWKDAAKMHWYLLTKGGLNALLSYFETTRY
jgi:hypothetical protein